MVDTYLFLSLLSPQSWLCPKDRGGAGMGAGNQPWTCPLHLLKQMERVLGFFLLPFLPPLLPVTFPLLSEPLGLRNSG